MRERDGRNKREGEEQTVTWNLSQDKRDEEKDGDGDEASSGRSEGCDGGRLRERDGGMDGKEAWVRRGRDGQSAADWGEGWKNGWKEECDRWVVPGQSWEGAERLASQDRDESGCHFRNSQSRPRSGFGDHLWDQCPRRDLEFESLHTVELLEDTEPPQAGLLFIFIFISPFTETILMD
ncbi:unnamed protein product [Pleuronectes platessa]|uniref:Uncharacterized protein n=1 Tax=Pleuronectes platessa TaxID=8262 RepID=A0A9N7YZT1_PLEPL|nr:unnamed protein product [Pleuronectes platessa]